MPLKFNKLFTPIGQVFIACVNRSRLVYGDKLRSRGAGPRKLACLNEDFDAAASGLLLLCPVESPSRRLGGERERETDKLRAVLRGGLRLRLRFGLRLGDLLLLEVFARWSGLLEIDRDRLGEEE